MLLNLFFQWLFKKRLKTDSFIRLLLNWEYRFNLLLVKLRTEKNYDQLQRLEEVLRNALLRVLEVKGEIGASLVKKDFELNKDLVAKIQAQAAAQPPINSQPQTKPRFNVN